MYQDVLAEVRDKLIAKGVVSHFKLSIGVPFWQPGHIFHDEAAPCVPCVDVTFVDDEAVVLVAKTPATLDLHLQMTLQILVSVLEGRFAMTLNFKPGKSECMLKYRGVGTNQARKLRHSERNSDGHKVFNVSDCGSRGDVQCIVVDMYKHLGSCVSIDCNLTPEATKRVASANTAYAPLAHFVLGNSFVDTSRKFMLANTLIFSRLFYCVHVWSYFSGKPRVLLNNVYMKVIRKVVGKSRFGQSCPDLDVRVEAGMPSIDCCVRRARLMYVARVVKPALPNLLAVLQFRSRDGKSLPWVRMILYDFTVMLHVYPSKLQELGDPAHCADRWLAFIAKYPMQWKQLVKGYHTACNDGEGAAEDSSGPAVVVFPVRDATVPCFSFTCNQCNASFPTNKALMQHARIKHGIKCCIQNLVGDETVCPVCATEFSHRHALIAHLSDNRVRSRVRATSCKAAFLAMDRPAPPVELVQSLNLVHRRKLGDAQRLFGRTHVLVGKPANKPVKSVLSGVPAYVLRRVDPIGHRVRCRTKTCSKLAELRFSHVSTKAVRNKVSCKTRCSDVPYYSRSVY